MTDEPTHKNIEEKELMDPSEVPSKNNRRRLLKGAIAVPVVMTLHSGAALARTSNLVGAVATDPATQDLGRGDQLVCAVPDPTEEQLPPSHDLGDDPMIHLEDATDTQINDISLQTQMETCETRGGIMISATAVTSLTEGGVVLINEDII